jgi:SAM-dependent methyltransferase
MRIGLLRHLACPACRDRLHPAPPPASDQEVIEEGELRCAGCARSYSIVKGVPRCLVTDVAAATARTRRQYDFAWRRFGLREIEEGWEKDSARYLSLIPGELLGRLGSLGLDAGCGGGADLLRIAERGAEVIGVDLSEGVESASRATAHLPNVHVVQADIHRLPFPPGLFDFAYSFGVLHHLPDPSRGFRAIAELLKCGAPLITYLYEDFSDRSAMERTALRVVRAVRRVTSRAPGPILLALCWVAVPAVWLAFSLPARMLLRPFPRLAGRLPFRHTLRWPVLASDLFDRFSPAIEWRFSSRGLVELYRTAGFQAVETRRYRGWVSWGFKRDRTATAGDDDARRAVLDSMARG